MKSIIATLILSLLFVPVHWLLHLANNWIYRRWHARVSRDLHAWQDADDLYYIWGCAAAIATYAQVELYIMVAKYYNWFPNSIGCEDYIFGMSLNTASSLFLLYIFYRIRTYDQIIKRDKSFPSQVSPDQWRK